MTATTTQSMTVTFKSFKAACNFFARKRPEISYDIICEFVKEKNKIGEIVFGK